MCRYDRLTRSLDYWVHAVTLCLYFTLLLVATFTAQDVKWHPDGNALLVISRDQMCICFLADNEDVAT